MRAKIPTQNSIGKLTAMSIFCQPQRQCDCAKRVTLTRQEITDIVEVRFNVATTSGGLIMFKLSTLFAVSTFIVLMHASPLQAEEAAVSAERALPLLDGLVSHLEQTGMVVLSVLIILVLASISTWSIFCAKWFALRRVERQTNNFVENFWESRSLNDLNKRLSDFSPSPTREIFRVGYAELVRTSQIKTSEQSSTLATTIAIDNISRALHKTRIVERHGMERLIPLLAISASACPFIGLFGTVWGIMGAFEGIALTGDASLAAVAPGISEALIATAFGLAAAIPAAVGYNLLVNKIRGVLTRAESFSADFLNIIERYLVAEKTAPPADTAAS